MKKIFAILLAVCMLASAFAIFSIPAAASDDAWVVYGNARDYRDDFNEMYGDEYSNLPGYKYVSDGLQTISPNWENTSPRIGVQTGQKVNLKNGVYMRVRIDDFSMDASDKWYAFSISDTQYVDVGSTNKERDGERIIGMIRGNASDMRSEVEWRQSNYIFSGKSSMSIEAADRYDEDGNEYVTLVIGWDGSTYSVTVNGAPMAPGAVKWMNEHFADGEAYVGINIYNNKKGGEAGLTVVAFGETEMSAFPPSYNESQEPINYENRYAIAPIADPSTVPAGQPGVLINGSRDESDSKTTVKGDGIYSLTEDNYIHVTSDRDDVETSFTVKNSVSVDIRDFPVAIVLTRNLCTCDSQSCWAMEKTEMYIMAGDDVSASNDRMVPAISAGVNEPIECEDGNYLYFMINFLDVENTQDVEGRINALRFDIPRIKTNTPGRNEFDLCFVAFFRTQDEARAYVNEYLGIDDEGQNQEQSSESESVDNSEQSSESESVDNSEQSSESESNSETESKVETNAPAGNETESESEPTTPDGDGDDNASSGGCFGAVGFGAIAIVTAAAVAGFVTFKKKKD